MMPASLVTEMLLGSPAVEPLLRPLRAVNSSLEKGGSTPLTASPSMTNRRTPSSWSRRSFMAAMLDDFVPVHNM